MMTFCARLLLVFLAAGVLISPTGLQAQEGSSSFMGVEGTDEMSPLFGARSTLSRTRKSDEEQKISWSEVMTHPAAVQPIPDSFQKLFRTFTQGKLHRPHQQLIEKKAVLSLALEPPQFHLQERREITVTLILTNESNRQIRVIFPTTQRMVLLLKDRGGSILERWPNEEAAEPMEEIVAVNPHETAQFSQRLPTREMKQGENYTIEASLANNPQYKQTISVRPL